MVRKEDPQEDTGKVSDWWKRFTIFGRTGKKSIFPILSWSLAWLYLLWPITWSRSATVPLRTLGFRRHGCCVFVRILLLPPEQAQISLLDSERLFEGRPTFLHFPDSGNLRLDCSQSTPSWPETPDSCWTMQQTNTPVSKHKCLSFHSTLGLLVMQQ